MDQDTAKRVTSVLQGCGKTLAESTDELRKVAPETAWAPYRILVAEAMGVLYLDLLADIWREHPSLEPKGQEGTSYYDPDRFQLSREAAEIVLRATEDAKRQLQEARELLRGDDASAQARHDQVVEGVVRRLDLAAWRCKRQHPGIE